MSLLPDFQSALTGAVSARGTVRCLTRETVAPPVLSFLLNFPMLVVGLAGTMRFRYPRDGYVEEGALRRGDILVVPASCWYESLPAGSHEAITVLFGPRSVGLSRQAQRDGRLTATAKATLAGPPAGVVAEILPLLEQASARSPEGVAPHLARALVAAVAERLGRDEPGETGRANRLYSGLAMYVQKHCHTDLTRESVAREFQISPNHLSRLFSEEGLVKYVDYLNYARIHRAKFLLMNHPMSVNEVATAAGFRDTAYFCRVFKRVLKVTPSRYRAEHRAAW